MKKIKNWFFKHFYLTGFLFLFALNVIQFIYFNNYKNRYESALKDLVEMYKQEQKENVKDFVVIYKRIEQIGNFLTELDEGLKQ